MAAAKVYYSMAQAAGFDKDLINARDDLKKRAEAIHKQTAINVVRRAKIGAPDDPKTTSDDLRSSITYAGKGLNWRVGIDDKRYLSRGGDAAHQQPWIYGIWYEYGFMGMKIPTQPYMRPAADAEEEHHAKAMEDVINASLSGVTS